MTSKHRTKSSLERQLKSVAVILLSVLALLLVWLMQLLSLSYLGQITLLTVIFIPTCFWLSRFYQTVINPFYNLTSLVEAIRLEDYSLRARQHYHSGILRELTTEISALASELQQRKQIYDQHTLLIYHLIEQLDAPIAVFNHKLQLSHANAAFSEYIGKPWQSRRYCQSNRLGLVLNNEQQWQLTQGTESGRWQIRQSQFNQNNQVYYLVILSNIEQLMRSKQQESWQQIIRVLSHEIRNSLTPIKSLAQTLAEQSKQDPRSTQALQVIVDRSIALQEFVNRYGDISKRLDINSSWFECKAVMESILGIFPKGLIELNIETPQLMGDPILIKQVLINLIKNAIEASEQHPDNVVKVTIRRHESSNQDSSLIIEIKDNGQGIANPQNLFVPFYTTKKNGQGIGLGLCQNIIEQHGGRLTLANNTQESGATATIQLPIDTD